METVENEIKGVRDLRAFTLEYDKNRIALIDADSILYKALYGNDTLELISNAKDYFINRVDEIKECINCGSVELYFTGGYENSRVTNFRKMIDKDYKANRVNTLQYLQEFKKLIIKHYENMPHFKVYYSDLLEADDLIIEKANGENRDNYVVCCIDKDIIGNSIAKVFNFDKMVYFNNSMLEVSLFEFYQCLVGDRADNIKGLKGIGKVGATKIINQYKFDFLRKYSGSYAQIRNAFYYEQVLPLYIKQYKEKGYEMAMNTMQLVSLKQCKNGVLNLWNPNILKMELEYEKIGKGEPDYITSVKNKAKKLNYTDL